jgi:hypothetical protein
MNPRRVLTSVVMAAAISVAPATAAAALAQQLRMPKVDFDYDKEVDFTRFRTFRWKEGASDAPTAQARTRIVWYVERELEKKGLRKSPDDAADLLVRYYAKADKSLRGTPSQGESYLPGGTGSLTTSVDFSKVLEASLLIELQRATDAKTIWRAASEYRTIDDKHVDAETASAVRRLLARYPPPRP